MREGLGRHATTGSPKQAIIADRCGRDAAVSMLSLSLNLAPPREFPMVAELPVVSSLHRVLMYFLLTIFPLRSFLKSAAGPLTLRSIARSRNGASHHLGSRVMINR